MYGEEHIEGVKNSTEKRTFKRKRTVNSKESENETLKLGVLCCGSWWYWQIPKSIIRCQSNMN